MESSSLLPDDPSVLFTTAGMQQFKPYYTGQADAMKDFGSLNTASIQKSMRTSDIDEVGDASHLTFFEMMGNFSFGGYWKREAIQYVYDFITKEMGLEIDYVTVFEGWESIGLTLIGPDKESEQIWKSLDSKIRVEKRGKEDNFWGPTGEEGPCGPTTEIYVRGVEVWNIVFNEYYHVKGSDYKPLKTKGIDTGMGLERLAMVVLDKKNIFETDLFKSIFFFLPAELPESTKRIVADHTRAISFLISDGITPSNKEQGYVLRRLIRRVIIYNHFLPLNRIDFGKVFEAIVHDYGSFYPKINADLILREFSTERDKFMKTLQKGLQETTKLRVIDNIAAFKLYESYGLPFEVIREVGKLQVHEMKLTREGFDEEFKKHQEKSRAGAEKKFGGHGLLLDTGELKAGNEEELKKVTRLHTATHLLHAALRKILGEDIKQQGSDITPERLRFDFTYIRKLTSEELKQTEDMVNDIVKKEMPVTKTETSYADAVKSGALAFFKHKYPNRVTVYTIGPEPAEGHPSETSGPPFSRELCGGPHVSNTSEVGRFKILKEESISAGVRRIRAIVE